MADNKANETQKPKRQHKATYSRDKRKGGYLVRVVGPHATEFVGREVPVSRNDGTEGTEKLTRLITSGIDDGQIVAADKGKTYALYAFEAKPRGEEVAEF